MDKVKLTRKEYRENYLRSEEWKSLRDEVMSNHNKCQRCMLKEPHDVHHLVYKKDIFNATVEELIAVCRECHKDIHYALDCGLIPKKGNLDYIRRKTLFLTKKQINDRKKYRKNKHEIGYKLTDKILQCNRLAQQLITKEIGLAIVYKNRDKIANLYVTGVCLERIKSKIKINKGVDKKSKNSKTVFSGRRDSGKRRLSKEEARKTPRPY